MVRIGIIGTAGRLEDKDTSNKLKKMNKELYNKMKLVALALIERMNEEEITLVSGGAAWSDHLAVNIYLNNDLKCKLQLYLPAEWDTLNKDRYVDSAPGRISNNYHKAFSKKTHDNDNGTLEELNKAICSDSCKVNIRKGFHARNNLIAHNVDYLIAFTWGDGEIPKDGGTLHTWNSCPSSVKKLHIPLKLL